MDDRRRKRGPQLLVRLRPRDWEELEMWKEVHGLSFSAAVRLGLRALRKELGRAEQGSN